MLTVAPATALPSESLSTPLNVMGSASVGEDGGVGGHEPGADSGRARFGPGWRVDGQVSGEVIGMSGTMAMPQRRS